MLTMVLTKTEIQVQLVSFWLLSENQRKSEPEWEGTRRDFPRSPAWLWSDWRSATSHWESLPLLLPLFLLLLSAPFSHTPHLYALSHIYHPDSLHHSAPNFTVIVPVLILFFLLLHLFCSSVLPLPSARRLPRQRSLWQLAAVRWLMTF